MVSALDSEITGSTYADPDIAACFSDEAEIQAYLAFEIALAKSQENLGIIPQGCAAVIADALDGATIDYRNLERGFRNDGIIVPELIAVLRSQLPAGAANYLHFGVTSQDVIDTALTLRMKRVIELITRKNERLCAQLITLIQDHRYTLTIARTRNQNAAPTVFGLKVVNWLRPLQRRQDAIRSMMPNLLKLQLGGAVGTMAALGTQAEELNSMLAEELGLQAAESPWHVQRDEMVGFSDWLSTTAGTVGKMGQDMLLLSQSEIAELRFKQGGKSSTLPNKSNPVLPEFLITLAKYTQFLSNTFKSTLVASNERDGISIMLENLTLPSLACAAGASISLASNAIDLLEVDCDAMARNIERDGGRFLAEAMSFQLRSIMGKAEASRLVGEACSASLRNGTHMIDELSSAVEADFDWNSLKNPLNALGEAQKIIDRSLG